MIAFRGLRIHQGKAKCGQRSQQQPCTASAGETRGTRSQVENHSANGPYIAGSIDGTEEESPLVEADPLQEHQHPIPTISHRTEPKAEAKKPARTNKLKWTEQNEAEAWCNLDTDLIKILKERLHGGVKAKLNLFWDIIYQTCKDKFCEVISKQRTALRERGRREKEITQLVQRR